MLTWTPWNVITSAFSAMVTRPIGTTFLSLSHGLPLSKKRDKERKAAQRAEKAAKKAGGAALLPKALVKRMRLLGVDPHKYLTAAPVSLDDYKALERRLEAKVMRVEWQSGGIRMLHDEIATLKAQIETMGAMQDLELKQRVAQLEADLALHEAVEAVVR